MENEQPKKRKRLTDEERLARAAKKEQAAKEEKAALENRIKKRKRTRENKQKFLVGAAMLNEAESDPKVKKFLYDLLGKFLTREYDRSFFSEKDTDPFVLPPLADKNKDKQKD
jgi:hypothetical protein